MVEHSFHKRDVTGSNPVASTFFMNKIELSIIIISYNTKQITFDCLQSIYKSLKKTKIDYEVIVIDNASTDESVQSIDQLNNNKIRLIVNKINLGFAKANNQAVKEARGEYLLFLNSDIIVQDDAIEKLFNFYQRQENIMHFFGGKLFNKDKTPQPSCGPFYSLPVVFCALFLRGDYWGLTRYSPNVIKEVNWISGACILTKKEYFNQINGFDENIFMYMDEIDLLYRAKKQGLKVGFYPNAQFIHLGSASSNEKAYPILQVFNGFMYFYQKHHSVFQQFLLKIMLKLKAGIGILLGFIFNNSYLKETYGKAYKMVKMVGQ